MFGVVQKIAEVYALLVKDGPTDIGDRIEDLGVIN